MKLLPFFAVSYVTASIFINCLNFNTSFGKTERKNICLLAFLNILPPLLLTVAGYGYFFITGVNGFYGTNNQISDWMVAPLVPMLVTPFITRANLQKDKEPIFRGYNQCSNYNHYDLCKCTDSISSIRENVKSSNKYSDVNRWVFVAQIFYFSRCQISRLYSAMVRSLENMPAFAMLIRHLRRHPIGSQA